MPNARFRELPLPDSRGLPEPVAEAAALDEDEEKAREMIGLLQAKRFAVPPVVSATGNDLIDLIREERQRELCLEGHRWYDLRRYTVCTKYP